MAEQSRDQVVEPSSSVPENASFCTHYSFQALDRSQREFRLIRVYPRRLRLHQAIGLNRTWKHIREPDNDDDGNSLVVCEILEHQKLDDMVDKYPTLSYCWGSAKRTRKVIVNGLIFNAVANLEHALESFRASQFRVWQERNTWLGFIGPMPWDPEPSLLWTDQICINQHDMVEKSWQVSLMKDIYSKASEVFICLSEASDIDKLSWWEKRNKNQLHHMVTSGVEKLPTFVFSIEPVAGLDWWGSFVFGILYRTKIRRQWAPWLEKFAEAMYHLAAASWWRRAWIFQEFLLSKKRTILWYGYTMAWSKLDTVMKRLRPAIEHWDQHLIKNRMQDNPAGRGIRLVAKQYTLHTYGNSEYISEMIASRSERAAEASLAARLTTSLSAWAREEENAHGLRQILANAYRFESTVPKDMIYAFLGAARTDCGITVDYSQTYGQILVHAAQRIIQTDKNLVLLIEAAVRKFTNSGAIGVCRYPPSDHWQIRQRLKAVQNLPSWVPDWSIPPTNEDALDFLGHPFGMEMDWGLKPLPDAWTQSGQDFEPKFLHVGPGLPVCGLKISGELICTLERFADDSTSHLFRRTRWKGLVEGSHALEENYITVESTAEATTRDQVWDLDGFALYAILRLFDYPSHDLYEFVSLAKLKRSRLGSTSTNDIEPKRNVTEIIIV